MISMTSSMTTMRNSVLLFLVLLGCGDVAPRNYKGGEGFYIANGGVWTYCHEGNRIYTYGNGISVVPNGCTHQEWISSQ